MILLLTIITAFTLVELATLRNLTVGTVALYVV